MIKLTDLTVGQADKVAEKIVEKFIRESEILEMLPFDDTVSPSGKGSTLVYSYVQEKLPSMASFRAIGEEYSPNEGTLEDKNVRLKIFGGSFQIDRVIKTIEGKLENMERQINLKTVAAVQLFHDKMINGDIAINSKEFDGLDKMLVGTENEMNTDSYMNLSTNELLKANALDFYEMLTKLIDSSNADAIICNKDMKTKIQTVAMVLGYKTQSEEAFGRKITKIGDVRIIDLKNKYEVTGEGDQAVATKIPIIPANKERSVGTGLGTYTLTTDTAINTSKTYYTRSGEGTTESPYVYTKVTTPVVANIATYYEEDGVYVTGLTDIYAVHFDEDEGFTGCSVYGDKVISQYLPDFNKPGAVKTGEVEMVAAVCLKNTQNAGVLRNIKIN